MQTLTRKMLAGNLIKRRLELELSQNQVSILTNGRVTANQISGFERATAIPSTPSLFLLAQALQTTMDALCETHDVAA